MGQTLAIAASVIIGTTFICFGAYLAAHAHRSNVRNKVPHIKSREESKILHRVAAEYALWGVICATVAIIPLTLLLPSINFALRIAIAGVFAGITTAFMGSNAKIDKE
ncbi:hypothetical protein [Mycobacteroides abscessus]|uniref:hypothetical protein n=1 Tax=Mycobacteroides abscessus TaxID=36809 RepID=UPI001300142C|nr:hypothetical protein [Mycobacteroides abscessus]